MTDVTAPRRLSDEPTGECPCGCGEAAYPYSYGEADGYIDAAPGCAARLAEDARRHNASTTPRARLDAEGTAKPRTRLVGHARRGDCLAASPIGAYGADAIEDTATGARTPLYGPPGEPKAPAMLAYAAKRGLPVEHVTLGDPSRAELRALLGDAATALSTHPEDITTDAIDALIARLRAAEDRLRD